MLAAREQGHLETWNLKRREQGAGVGICYPISCYLQPALELLGYSRGDLPATERIADEILALPIYPELSSEQRTYVVDKIRGFHAG